APGDDRARPGDPLIEELRAGLRHRERGTEPAGDIPRRQAVMQSSRGSALSRDEPSRDMDNAVPITPTRLLPTAQPRLPAPYDEGEPRKSSEQTRKRNGEDLKLSGCPGSGESQHRVDGQPVFDHVVIADHVR